MNEEFKSAVSLYESGQLSKSKKICEKILKTNSNHFDSLRLLSIIEYLKKNYQEANKLIDSAIKISPNNAMIYNDKGTILINLKKLEDALKNFDKAINPVVSSNLYSLSFLGFFCLLYMFVRKFRIKVI